MVTKELADIGQQELEIVLRKKATKEVLYKAKVRTYSIGRRMVGFRNYGDLNLKEILPAPDSTFLQAVLESSGDERKAFEKASKMYDTSEQMV